MSRVTRVSSRLLSISLFVFGLHALSENARAQRVIDPVAPNVERILRAQPEKPGSKGRSNGYVSRGGGKANAIRYGTSLRTDAASGRTIPRPSGGGEINVPAAPIAPGTPLTQLLHVSQLSLSSTAGTNEQYFDRDGNLIADDRTTFDSSSGSFDIAVGRSGTRYEVYQATLQGQLVGVLVLARDTNGDYFAEIPPTTFNLRTDFGLRSAAAVVTGNARDGREFVVVCSSGYYNSSDTSDPNNEPSPGVVLFVRDPVTGNFDDSRTRTLVTVGDNRLYNANAMALLPNNDLLIADFNSNELRIVRDTNADGLPDTLSTTPYYSYRFSNDAPLDVAVNPYGVVFSHSVGNDTVMLALYDDNSDGIADRDEVCVEGLSLDNNLYLHGLTVDGKGSVYVIENASGSADGPEGNSGTPRIDAFPDPQLDGFLTDGSVFARADDAFNQALTGLSFGVLPANKIDDAQFFVRQHYLDFLSREADASGLAFWTNEIISCGTNAQCRELKRINVSAAFFISIEFKETGYLVYKFYQAAYGDLPGAPVPILFDEFIFDTRLVGEGVVVGQPNWQQILEDNKVEYAAAFVARSSFVNAYSNSLTPAQFVDALFANAGVTPTASERSAAINEFGPASTSGDLAARGRALRRVAENPTLTAQELNRAFVLMQYFGYLRRDPNAAPDSNFNGYNFWLNKLLEFNGDYIAAEMVKAFITSTEYRQRFD